MVEMQELVDKVIGQIQLDIDSGDVTALEELLKRVPAKVLKSYLPEIIEDENLEIEIDDISHIGE